MTDPAPVVIGDFTFDAQILHLPIKDEDAHVVIDHYAAVTDGATSLGPSDITPAQLAAYAAHRVGEISEPSLRTAVRVMLSEFREINAGNEAPHAAAVWARRRGDFLEIGSLSDCMGIVQLRDGSVQATKPSRKHATIDDAAARQILQHMREGASFEDARSAAQAILTTNRQLANRREGYWVAGIEPEASRHLSMLKVRIEEISSLLLCSDGFTRLISPFRAVPTPAALLHWSQKRGLVRLGEILRDLENAPGSVLAAPRTSIHDDVTAVLLQRAQAS